MACAHAGFSKSGFADMRSRMNPAMICVLRNLDIRIKILHKFVGNADHGAKDDLSRDSVFGIGSGRKLAVKCLFPLEKSTCIPKMF
jgi:CubicO group peptidase (beta-lactamase class C family)